MCYFDKRFFGGQPHMKNFIFISFLLIGTCAFGQTVPKTAKTPAEFVPPGYVLLEEIKGDLNKDNQTDYVLIIKGTDRGKFVEHEFRGELDLNRRGIIVAFKKGDQYELVLENRACFLSENEDGGGYLPPDLTVSIEKGNLFVHYSHGRYGYVKYNFRYQNSDFELIGFDSSSNRGPVVNRAVSINFMTKKIRILENKNESAEGGDEEFEETWESFKLTKSIKLREIADFDDLHVKGIFNK